MLTKEDIQSFGFKLQGDDDNWWSFKSRKLLGVSPVDDSELWLEYDLEDGMLFIYYSYLNVGGKEKEVVDRIKIYGKGELLWLLERLELNFLWEEERTKDPDCHSCVFISQAIKEEVEGYGKLYEACVNQINTLMQEEINKMDEDNYSPYCPICSGCGEDGCCSAIVCEHHPDGHYCEHYLKELQFGYICYKELLDIAVLTPEQDKKFTEKWNEAYDSIWPGNNKEHDPS